VTDKARGQKRILVGRVVSDKMDKTISVVKERTIRHPQYGKLIKRRMVVKAHDEKNAAKIGDLVELIEARRLSKTKSWRLARILEGETVV